MSVFNLSFITIETFGVRAGTNCARWYKLRALVQIARLEPGLYAMFPGRSWKPMDSALSEDESFTVLRIYLLFAVAERGRGGSVDSWAYMK